MFNFSVLQKHQAGCLHVLGCFPIYFKTLKPPGRGRSGMLASCHLLSTSEPASFNGINFSLAVRIQIHLLFRFCDSSLDFVTPSSAKLLDFLVERKASKAKQAKERNTSPVWIFRILHGRYPPFITGYSQSKLGLSLYLFIHATGHSYSSIGTM